VGLKTDVRKIMAVKIVYL